MPQRSSRARGSDPAPGTRGPGRATRGSATETTDPLARAVGLLARRSHSQWELRRKLRQKGHAPEAIEAAMGRLAELGYLNDQAFASELVRRRGSLRGPRALSAELAARGVDRAQADAAVAEFDAESQLDAATRLVERLYARTPGIGYRQMLDSIGTKLLRRGFSTTIVRTACRSVLTATAQEPDD